MAVPGESEDGVFRWGGAEAAMDSNFLFYALANLTVSSQDMIEDLHGSKAYRANLVKVLTARAVKAAN